MNPLLIKLAYIADTLDDMGNTLDASVVDGVIKKIAQFNENNVDTNDIRAMVEAGMVHCLMCKNVLKMMDNAAMCPNCGSVESLDQIAQDISGQKFNGDQNIGNISSNDVDSATI